MLKNIADLGCRTNKITCNYCPKSVLTLAHPLNYNPVATSARLFTLHLSSFLLHALNRTSVSLEKNKHSNLDSNCKLLFNSF